MLYNSKPKITSIVTWDLKRNLEDRSLEVVDETRITKGVNSNLNYINQNGITYDLEFSFPLKFFADFKDWTLKQYNYEACITENKDLFVLRDSANLGVSVTMNESERRFLNEFSSLKEVLSEKSFP